MGMFLYRLTYTTGRKTKDLLFPSRYHAQQYLKERTSAHIWNIKAIWFDYPQADDALRIAHLNQQRIYQKA